MNTDLKQIKNYIFDLDGTIVDSSSEVLLCFKKAFDKAGIKIDESKFTSDVIGPPLKDILTLLAPELKDENQINNVISYFRSFYDYNDKDISIMYDGVLEVLTYLKQKGFKLFVATLKPMIPTLRLLKKFNLENFFDDIYTIDKFGCNITKKDMIEDIISKYQIKKEETVMIGDALSDMEAAKIANINAYAVLWGYSSNKNLFINKADKILNYPMEVLNEFR